MHSDVKGLRIVSGSPQQRSRLHGTGRVTGWSAAGLVLGRFQLQGHGQVVGQPQRQQWQRLTDDQGVSARPKVVGNPCVSLLDSSYLTRRLTNGISWWTPGRHAEGLARSSGLDGPGIQSRKRFAEQDRRADRQTEVDQLVLIKFPSPSRSKVLIVGTSTSRKKQP